MKTFTYEELKNVAPEDPILLEEGNVIVTLSEIRQCDCTAYIKLEAEIEKYSLEGIDIYTPNLTMSFP